MPVPVPVPMCHRKTMVISIFSQWSFEFGVSVHSTNDNVAVLLLPSSSQASKHASCMECRSHVSWKNCHLTVSDH